VPCLRNPCYYQQHYKNHKNANSHLKSYSSTPNLFDGSSTNKLAVKPFHGVINPLFQDDKSTFYEDSQEESGISNSPSPSILSQSSSYSPPPPIVTGGKSNNKLLNSAHLLSPINRNHLHYGSLQEIQTHGLLLREAGPCSVPNSCRLNPYELVDKNEVNSQAVLVEIIRKPERLQVFEANEGFSNKRHSIGSELVENGKFVGVNVDGKKNTKLTCAKRFGKFGRRHTEEVYVKCSYDEDTNGSSDNNNTVSPSVVNGGNQKSLINDNCDSSGDKTAKKSTSIEEIHSDQNKVLNIEKVTVQSLDLTESADLLAGEDLSEQDRSLGTLCSLDCRDQQDRSLSSANCPVVDVVVAKNSAQENSLVSTTDEKIEEEGENISMPFVKNEGVVANEKFAGKLCKEENTRRIMKIDAGTGRNSSNGELIIAF